MAYTLNMARDYLLIIRKVSTYILNISIWKKKENQKKMHGIYTKYGPRLDSNQIIPTRYIKKGLDSPDMEKMCGNMDAFIHRKTTGKRSPQEKEHLFNMVLRVVVLKIDL